MPPASRSTTCARGVSTGKFEVESKRGVGGVPKEDDEAVLRVPTNRTCRLRGHAVTANSERVLHAATRPGAVVVAPGVVSAQGLQIGLAGSIVARGVISARMLQTRALAL